MLVHCQVALHVHSKSDPWSPGDVKNADSPTHSEDTLSKGLGWWGIYCHCCCKGVFETWNPQQLKEGNLMGTLSWEAARLQWQMDNCATNSRDAKAEVYFGHLSFPVALIQDVVSIRWKGHLKTCLKSSTETCFISNYSDGCMWRATRETQLLLQSLQM